MRVTRKQLRKIIREAMGGMSAANQGAGSVDEWLSWGDNLGLDAEYDNDRQLIFYTMDPMEAREAETMGAEVEKDSSGLMVIYTGAMK